ncbi:hypothetical protein [Streptomyces sp. NPDC055793]
MRPSAAPATQGSRPAAGWTVIGHKVGLTSVTMRELPSVSDPNFGHPLGEMGQRDGVDGTRRPFA